MVFCAPGQGTRSGGCIRERRAAMQVPGSWCDAPAPARCLPRLEGQVGCERAYLPPTHPCYLSITRCSTYYYGLEHCRTKYRYPTLSTTNTAIMPLSCRFRVVLQ